MLDGEWSIVTASSMTVMAVGVKFVEWELRHKFRNLILDHQDSRIESERLQEAAQQKATAPSASQGFIVQGVKDLPVQWESSDKSATSSAPKAPVSTSTPLVQAG